MGVYVGDHWSTPNHLLIELVSISWKKKSHLFSNDKTWPYIMFDPNEGGIEYSNQMLRMVGSIQ